MDGQAIIKTRHHAIVGIGKGAASRKAYRLIRIADLSKAWMLANVKATPHHIVHQALLGQWQ